MKSEGLHKKTPISKDLLNVLDGFACSSTFHGLRYIFRKNSSNKERVGWFIAVVTSMTLAVLVGSYAWRQYSKVPTVIEVKDTHQPLYTTPFPTVTVCSGTRVRRGVARALLSKYLPSDMPTRTKENLMLHVMSSLSLLQFPNYNLIKSYLRTQEAKQWIHLFADLNITQFMLKVMPTCGEVFHECLWHGTVFNCCDIFFLQRTEEGFCWSFNSLTSEIASHWYVMPTCGEVFHECLWHGTVFNCCDIFFLQRTEEGFCWSFNSLTSEIASHCPLSEVLENEGLIEDADLTQRLECHLRRNTGTSTGSGLELILLPSDPRDNIGYRAQRVVNGVSILIHTSYEFPRAGTGVYASNVRGSQSQLGITAEVTRSSQSIRRLSPEVRKCVFPDEHRLHMYHVYTENTCLVECRVKYILLICRCKLYFFSLPDQRAPFCGILHLSCISNLSDKLRFYRPPEGTRAVTDRELMDSLTCDCPATCFDSTFDISVYRRVPESSANQSLLAHVDVYYSKAGFIRYERQVVIELTDLIVSFGGIANLFLGCSLVTMAETSYWLYKISKAAVKAKNIQQKIIKVHPLDFVH